MKKMLPTNGLAVSRFIDITIYRRVSDDTFVSLSDMDIDTFFAPSGAIYYYEIKGIDKSYNYVLSVLTGTAVYSAGVKLVDIVALAGISGKAFIKQMQTGVDEVRAEDIIAELCAKKIRNYSHGKCIQELRDTSGCIYINFYRRIFLNTQMSYPAVLSKAFRNIPVKVKEVRVWDMKTESERQEITVIR